MIKIKNGSIIVGIKEKGAELASLVSKTNEIEYIWKADPRYWGRHSCILFPVIGATCENVIHIADQEYPMKKHGLVRDIQFELTDHATDHAVFEVRSSETSRELYPFAFSLGGHPGITCPFTEDKRRSDYHLLFDQLETQDSPILSHNGLITSEIERVLDNSNRIDIKDELFDQDALILSNFNSSTVSIVDNNDVTQVTVGIEGFTHLGIWSEGRDSPYVCIEPWMGHADPEGYSGDFYDKPGNVVLEKGGFFRCEHWIRVV